MGLPLPLPPSCASPDEWVAHLRDLYAGSRWVAPIAALGDRAVPALEAMLRGPSESIPHRRCLAADTLALIGSHAAWSALRRALADASARTPLPPQADAEQVVITRITEHLATQSQPEFTDALLHALTCHPYAGGVHALAARGDERAIPLLVRCLEDDAARAAAMKGLPRFGAPAVAPLIRALAAPVAGERESPGHIDARAAAATALSALHLPAAQYALTKALNDPQRSVRIAAALGLAADAPDSVAERVAKVLVENLGAVDWARANDIASALVQLGSRAEPIILSVLKAQLVDGEARAARVRAVAAAARLGLHSALPVLAAMATSDDSSLRLAAIGVLAHHPDTTAPMLRRFLSDEVAVIRKKALQALCERDAIGADQIAVFLGDADERIRLLARERLRALGKAALPALRRAAHQWRGPVHGLANRWHLWTNAWQLLATVVTQHPSRHRRLPVPPSPPLLH